MIQREALHDADGFLKTTVPFITNHTWATVATDNLFLCDEHWLRCECGTGYFVGIHEIWCPKCHAKWFFKKEIA